MPNSARLNTTVTNLISGVSTPSGAIAFVGGKTKRGPINDASIIINSWPQFVRLFGGEISTSDFPTLCKMMLLAGTSLRVNRVVNYAAGVTSAVKAASVNVVSGANTLFKVRPKYHGADYNNIRIVISAASNGDASYFNLAINHLLEPELNEVYPNLKINGTPTIEASTFLDTPKKRSELVDFEYVNLSALTGPLRPTDATVSIVGGADGDAVAATDYVGDQATKNGLYAFDDYSDSYILAFPDVFDTTVHVSGAAYANGRGDLVYLAHLDNDVVTAANLVTERAEITTDSAYYGVFAGGLKILDSSGNIKPISELGGVIASAIKSITAFGPWYSFAGSKRGKIDNVLGVVNNFGSPATYASLNQLANNQINMVVMKDGLIKISGNFSGQKSYDQLSYLNITMLVIFLKKTLGPILESYLEDPTDLTTFRLIYHHVKPLLDSLASKEKRALWGYSWQGDQEATSLDTLQINKKADVLLGKYKVICKITPIASMQEITLAIELTSEGVQFSIL